MIQSIGYSVHGKKEQKYVNKTNNCTFIFVKKKSHHVSVGFVYKFAVILEIVNNILIDHILSARLIVSAQVSTLPGSRSLSRGI